MYIVPYHDFIPGKICLTKSVKIAKTLMFRAFIEGQSDDSGSICVEITGGNHHE